MGRNTTQERTGCATAVAVATLSITGLAAPAGPLAAQEVIELPSGDRPLDADVEEIYRLGSVAGDGWDTFGRVAGVGFDGAGNLYILDTQAVRIYVVDSQGNLVRQFIGEGEGPGEFGSDFAVALRFAVVGDGRVAVYDPGRVEFAFFGADGEFERTIPVGGDRTRRPILWDIQAFPGMERVLSTTLVSYMSRPDPGPGPQFRYVLSYDLSSDEAAVDTAATAWKPPDDRQAFRPELMAGALPGGGVVHTDSSAYAIKFTAPGGRVTRIVTRPFPPRPVTDRIRNEEIERRLGCRWRVSRPRARARPQTPTSFRPIAPGSRSWKAFSRLGAGKRAGRSPPSRSSPSARARPEATIRTTRPSGSSGR